MTRISRAEMLGVSGSLLIFLLFGSAWIHLPGPQQDELAYVSTLLPWLRPGAPFSLRFHGQYFPMMVASYAGTLKGWLLALWFLVVPWGIPGYRAFGIVLGVATVWLVFWFIRQYYGRPIASLATVIVGLDVNERRGDAIRADLWRKTAAVLHELDRLGVHTPNRSGFPIIEVPLARHEDVDAVGRFLFDNGIYVTLAAYPLVPRSEVGFRVQVTAANTDAEIEQLIDVLGRLVNVFDLQPARTSERAA